MTKKKLKKKPKIIIITIILLVILTAICYILEYQHLSNRDIVGVEEEKEFYTSSDFGLVDIKSPKDNNYDGIDDYKQMLTGALKKIESTTIYKSDYYGGGYPKENEGVSSDIIWSALLEAGYNLKDMMSKDIRNTYKEKVYNIEDIDDNIDFRRINNIETFLQRYGKKLTNNIKNIKEFNVGDIIIFDYGDHVGIISDKRNKNGISYIVELTGKKETTTNLEDINREVTGHYRFEYQEKLRDLMS